MEQHAGSSPAVFDLDIQTSFGRLRGRMRLPAAEMRLAEFAWNLMPMDDQFVAMGVARGTGPKANGLQISCCRGCGACCRQLVPLSPPEAFMLADLVLSMPREQRDPLLARFAQTREALANSGVEMFAAEKRPSEADIMEMALKYFELGLPCPFLEDEACSIHPNRPSICREFLVTTPAALCTNPRLNRVDRVPVPAELSDWLSKLYARVVGGPVMTVPMPEALAWVECNWEQGQRRWDTNYLFTNLIEIIQSPPPVVG